MRCSSTNQFASYEDAEAEADDVSVDSQQVEVSFRAWRTCAECGSEAAEYTDTASGSIEHLCTAYPPEDEEEDFEVVDDNPALDVDEYSQTHDAKGRPIRNPRYSKHLFKVTGEVEVKCLRCAETITVPVEAGGIAASWFEDTGH